MGLPPLAKLRVDVHVYSSSLVKAPSRPLFDLTS